MARIALIAHDNFKDAMVAWANRNKAILEKHELFATGTTGARLQKEAGLQVQRFKSGPLGGDQQIGAKIAQAEIDVLIFFWDPMAPHPHDVDVKALLRIAVVYNVRMACNEATADSVLQAGV